MGVWTVMRPPFPPHDRVFGTAWFLVAALFTLAAATSPASGADVTSLSYPVVGTGQTPCYGNSAAIACPAAGQPFHGQDAPQLRSAPSYRGNGYGTTTDLNSGLTWVQAAGGPCPGIGMTFPFCDARGTRL